MSAIDWALIALYFGVTVAVGLRFSKRASTSLEQYFVAGRQAPWWLAGAGMIATTFAADTPLVVTGLVAAHGVAGNWLWWCMVMSGVLTVFVTARLWHRAGVISDVELVELRYGGRPAAFLRVFRALFLALPVNLIILGWVHLAMVKVLTITLGVDPMIAMFLCFVVTLVYAALGGLWAALWTDLVQLVIMMTAVIVLAVFAVDKVGGLDALADGVTKHFGSRDAALSPWPPSSFTDASSPWLPPLALFVFLAVQWWAAWYPGSEPGGGGYVAQRIFSTKSEKDGVLSVLFFNVGHYALRPWPWIVTGLCTVLLYPDAIDKEGAYAQAIVDLLPAGLKGFLLAGFAAAYMSTVSTHLNWGASYLVNDVYKRFFAPEADQRSLVRASRLATVLTFMLSTIVMTQMTTIEGAWKLLLALGSGTGLVLILRWLWWRVNAWSEIVAMIASVTSSLVAWRLFAGDDLESQAKVMLFTVATSTVAWLVATFVTKPESDAVLVEFVGRVRPPALGWSSAYARMSTPRPPARGREMLAAFVLGVVLVYASVFAGGLLIFGPRWQGALLAVVAVACFLTIARVLLPRLLGDDDGVTPPAPRER